MRLAVTRAGLFGVLLPTGRLGGWADNSLLAVCIAVYTAPVSRSQPRETPTSKWTTWAVDLEGKGLDQGPE